MGCGSSVQSPPGADKKDGPSAIPVSSGETTKNAPDSAPPAADAPQSDAQQGGGIEAQKQSMGRRQGTQQVREQNSGNKAGTPTTETVTAGLVGSAPTLTDQRACPEHFFLIFSLWPVVRPGVPEFLHMLNEKKKAGEVQRIYIYTANTSLHWVRFIMQCIMQYYAVPLDTFDGIKHAPGGLKVVPDGAVLYDDHPENAIGRCVAVDPYTNEIPWEILGPILQKLPDHSEASCPLWDECGGLKKFIERDQQYEDPPHNEASESTMFALKDEFVAYDEVLLDLDETLIAGARLSAYFNALNHFLMFRESTGPS